MNQNIPIHTPTAEGWLAAYHEFGVVLLRGGELSLAEFEMLSRELCGTFHHVPSRQALVQGSGDGYSTQVFSDNFILLAHSEGAYRPCLPAPEVCFFLCTVPPEASGGETFLVDGVEMLAALPDELRQRFVKEGVIYECRWESERWRCEFGVTNERELRAMLHSSDKVSFEIDCGTLSLSYAAQAVIQSGAGKDTFANGIMPHLPEVEHPRYSGLPIYAKPTNRVLFGDGTPLTREVINALIDAQDEVKFKHSWRRGDVLVFDNKRFMHGREMTSASCQRVLFSRFGYRHSAGCA